MNVDLLRCYFFGRFIGRYCGDYSRGESIDMNNAQRTQESSASHCKVFTSPSTLVIQAFEAVLVHRYMVLFQSPTGMNMARCKFGLSRCSWNHRRWLLREETSTTFSSKKCCQIQINLSSNWTCLLVSLWTKDHLQENPYNRGTTPRIGDMGTLINFYHIVLCYMSLSSAYISVVTP